MAVTIKDPGGCIGCACCVEACPMGVLDVEDTVKISGGSDCISCGLCVEACPADVLTVE